MMSTPEHRRNTKEKDNLRSGCRGASVAAGGGGGGRVWGGGGGGGGWGPQEAQQR